MKELSGQATIYNNRDYNEIRITAKTPKGGKIKIEFINIPVFNIAAIG